MLFNAIMLMFIVLITMFLSTQGLLTSLIALVTAIFSSILAMALMEPLQNILAGMYPDYARGITLLVVFLVAFAVTRFAADAMIPENIKLPAVANRLGGGILGFVTALVIVGTLAAGVEMLPLPRVIMGFDRYPGDQAMQATEAPAAGGVPIGDLTKDSAGVWLNPDRFVEAIWKSVSGTSGSMGGTATWRDVHPDLSAESYGYRSTVANGSRRTIPADLFSVTDAWTTADAKQISALGIPPDGSRNRLVWIRVKVQKGDKEPHQTNDPNDDPYFRMTPTQIRLVTDKAEQFYPAGYLEHGQKFHPTPLDGSHGGHLVEDYADGSIIEDWVFLIPDGDKPAMVEMKQFGRQDLAALTKEKKPEVLSAKAYPPLEYQKDLSTVMVHFDAAGKKIESANVYLIDSASPLQSMEGELHPAYDNVSNIYKWTQDSSHGWSTTAKPGLPDPEVYRQGVNVGNRMTTDPPETNEPWTEAMPIILAGQAQPDVDEDLRIYRDFFAQHMVPLWTNAKSGAVLHGAATANGTGDATLSGVVAGKYCLVAVLQTDKGFYVWATDLNLDKAAHENQTFTAGKSAMFTIDADAKAPGK